MRIVHIITRMIVGGAQENTRFNCLDLVRDYGDDVTLITGPSLGAEGSLLDKYQDPDLKTILVPELIRSIRPWTDFRAAGIIQKHLTQLRPDVVHTHSAKAGILGRSVAWKLKIPCVVHTVHGAPFHPYQAWPVRRSKFVTIYSGMDIEPFLNADQNRLQLRKDLGIQPEDIVVGKIARLFHLKGHQYLLACAQRVVQADPRIRFLLVGDGILRESLEKEIASMGLQNHFIFTGLVPPHEIPDLIGAMDMLMHVSLREGLARALPQAMLAGKPVISYDIDGAKEVVIEDQTGILLPPKSIQPLGDAILKLANDADLRTRLGLQGRLLCQERFGHQSMTKQIRRLYEQILSG